MELHAGRHQLECTGGGRDLCDTFDFTYCKLLFGEEFWNSGGWGRRVEDSITTLSAHARLWHLMMEILPSTRSFPNGRVWRDCTEYVRCFVAIIRFLALTALVSLRRFLFRSAIDNTSLGISFDSFGSNAILFIRIIILHFTLGSDTRMSSRVSLTTDSLSVTNKANVILLRRKSNRKAWLCSVCTHEWTRSMVILNWEDCQGQQSYRPLIRYCCLKPMGMVRILLLFITCNRSSRWWAANYLG